MKNEFWLLGIIPIGLIAWIFTRPTISKEYLGKLPRNGKNAIRDLSKITGITVHWTATPRNISIESIARYHVDKQRLAKHRLPRCNKERARILDKRS
jgi:hypothetical protein